MAGSATNDGATPLAEPIPLLALGLVLALLAVALWPTLIALNGEWATANGHHSHGYLLLGIGLYYAWQRRAALRLERLSGTWLWLVFGATSGAALCWLLADLANVVLLQYLALPAMLAGCFLLVFGVRATLVALLPLFVIVFALPVWDYLNGPLQALSSLAVGRFLTMLGIPHFFTGNLVDLPNGSFLIENGCSGLGLLLTSLSLAAVLLLTSVSSSGQKLLVVVGAVLVALVANWVRIAIIVQQGYVTDMESSLIVDHLWLGWVVYAVLMMPLLLYAAGRLPTSDPSTDGAAAVSSQARYRSPVWLGFAMAVGLIAALIAAQRALTNPVDPALAQTMVAQLQAGLTQQGYQIEGCDDPCVSAWQPEFTAPDLRAAFQVDGGHALSKPIFVQTAIYLSEKQGKELIYFANKPRGALAITARQSNATSEDLRGTQFGRPFLLRYWYEVDGERHTAPMQVKWLQLKSKLQRSHAAAFVGLFTYCDSDCVPEVSAMDRVSRDWSHFTARAGSVRKSQPDNLKTTREVSGA